MGTGPFGHEPGLRMNHEIPRDGLVLAEPFPRRVRAVLGGETVVDSRRVWLVYEPGRLPVYAYPTDDVRLDLLEGVRPLRIPADAGLDGYRADRWHAMDKWLEEDDEVLGHAPDLYHRIDVRTTSRHVRVSLDGHLLAESDRARILFETSLAPRWYLPREDLVAEAVESEFHSICAYKGIASYLSLRVGDGLRENLAWYYPDPAHDGEPVRDLVCFFNEQVDLELDGELQERPRGPWADPNWWRGRK